MLDKLYNRPPEVGDTMPQSPMPIPTEVCRFAPDFLNPTSDSGLKQTPRHTRFSIGLRYTPGALTLALLLLVCGDRVGAAPPLPPVTTPVYAPREGGRQGTGRALESTPAKPQAPTGAQNAAPSPTTPDQKAVAPAPTGAPSTASSGTGAPATTAPASSATGAPAATSAPAGSAPAGSVPAPASPGQVVTPGTSAPQNGTTPQTVPTGSSGRGMEAPPVAAPRPAAQPSPPPAGVDGAPRTDPRVRAPAPAPGPAQKAIALAISGGTSRGAYQAGYLYYLLESLKRNPESLSLKVISGASAGSINTLLAALSACSEPWSDPRQSLFFKVWTGITLSRLNADINTDPRSLFGQKPLRDVAAQVQSAWDGGVNGKSCDLLVGIVATRSKEHLVRFGHSSDSAIPRQEERFFIRVTNDLRQMQARNYLIDRMGMPAGYPIAQPLLLEDQVLGATDRARGLAPTIGFEALTQLMLASAAFPGAFPPVRLPYCRDEQPVTGGGARTEGGGYAKGSSSDPRTASSCNPKQHRIFSTELIDGGVFENNPIRVAHYLARNGLRRDGERFAVVDPLSKPARDATVRPGSPMLSEGASAPQTATGSEAQTTGTTNESREIRTPGWWHQIDAEALRFIYLDPDERTYPAPSDQTPGQASGELGLLRNFLVFGSGMLTTAAGSQLDLLMQEDPRMFEGQLTRLAENNLPLASSTLLNFAGFIEDEFLVFDFYVGMYDAWRQVQDGILGERTSLMLPDTSSAESWKPFECLLAAVERGQSIDQACKGVDPRFQILLQVSLDRLYSDCVDYGAKEDESGELSLRAHPHCIRAIQGLKAPALSAAVLPERGPLTVKEASNPSTQRLGTESDFDYLMRRLEEYAFEFDDLNQGGRTTALSALRISLGATLDGLAKRQPTKVEQGLMGLFSLPALDWALRYHPRPWMAWLHVGSSWEEGFALHDPLPEALSLMGAVQHNGLMSMIFPTRFGALDTGTASITPILGIELQGSPVMRRLFKRNGAAAFQPYLGLRAGYRLYFERDSGFTPVCTDPKVLDCSAPIVQVALGTRVFETLRLQAVVEALPSPLSPMPFEDDALLGWRWWMQLGVQWSGHQSLRRVVPAPTVSTTR